MDESSQHPSILYIYFWTNKYPHLRTLLNFFFLFILLCKIICGSSILNISSRVPSFELSSTIIISY